MHDYGPNIVRINDGNCVAAALSNACGALYGEETALQVKKYFDSDPSKFQTLKQFFTSVHQLPIAVNIRRKSKSERVEFNVIPFEWLVNRCTGV